VLRGHQLCGNRKRCRDGKASGKTSDMTASDCTCRNAEKTLANRGRKARMRSGGETRFEQAEAAWFSYTHFTSRPAVETVLTDAEGHGYTVFHEVPGQRADPQIHVHNPLLNHLLQRDGRISAVDLNRLQGLLLVGGAVFQAYTARYLREAGHTVTRGEHGDAQIVGVGKALQRQFSKRHEHVHGKLLCSSGEFGQIGIIDLQCVDVSSRKNLVVSPARY
jgi:TrwC relaxase